MKNKIIQIRNSTIDFLVFTTDAKEQGVKVRVRDGEAWEVLSICATV